MKNQEQKKTLIVQDKNQGQKIIASSNNILLPGKTTNDSIAESKINTGKIIITALAIFVTLNLMNCNSPAEKVENTRENVIQAKEDLITAQQEHAAEVELFKNESNKEITAFDKKIAEIKNKIKNSNAKLKADYEKDISLLEQKNTDLKRKISEYKADKKEDWDTFKSNFHEDLNELGLALKNFAIDN
jgi:septal ring factor EnvC (AmiA/AmiB activator)